MGVDPRAQSRKYGQPTVFSILIYTHPEIGLPLAICDGSYRTVMCTGAAAVSVKWMARKNSKRLAVVGRPYGRGTLATCNVIFPWEEVEVWSQCRTDGEINVPLRQGLIKECDIAGEIGEVITGRKPGRLSEGEITLFDPTGVALQDSATVPLEYERAVAASVGVEKKMISA